MTDRFPSLSPRQAALWGALAIAGRIQAGARRRPRAPSRARWVEGVSVVVPEHANAELLGRCLDSVAAALEAVAEPSEVIVSVNGSPMTDYGDLRRRHPGVRWIHHPVAKGFLPAARRGAAAARHGAVYLLNNDMVVDPAALAELMPWRGPHVFAVASQIFFDDPAKRREETGWTELRLLEDDWPELADIEPAADLTVRGHLYAGGGSSLFDRDLLLRFMSGSGGYDPFYWEDAEWGLRAWREGLEVLYQPRSRVWHRHRATVAKVYAAKEIDRIFRRNRLQFALRNDLAHLSNARVVSCLPDSMTFKELTSPRRLLGLLAARWRLGRSPFPNPTLQSLRDKRYLTPPRGDDRPCALVVTPYTLLPPRHGGAIRVVRMLEPLAARWRLIAVADEPGRWPEAAAGPFAEIHLSTQRPPDDGSRLGRMRSHAHPDLAAQTARLERLRRPRVVQCEFVELAPLVRGRTGRAAWVLDAHDVLIGTGASSDLSDEAERELAARFDTVVACSGTDAALLAPLRPEVIPNGAAVGRGPVPPSAGRRELLMVAPFRYPPNMEGARWFVRDAFDRVRERHPGVRLVILGGDGAPAVAAQEPLLAGRADIEVVGGVDDLRPFYERCVLTLNPLMNIRGTSIKLIEALAAGRVCVSTREGARGFEDLGAPALITLDDIADFAPVIGGLLEDEPARLQLERTDPKILAPFDWARSSEALEALWTRLAREAR